MNTILIYHYAITVSNNIAHVYHDCTCVTSLSEADIIMFNTEEEMLAYIKENNLTLGDT